MDGLGFALDVGEEVSEGLEGVVEAQSLELGRLIIAEEVDEGQPVRKSLRAIAVGEVGRRGGEELGPGAGEIRWGRGRGSDGRLPSSANHAPRAGSGTGAVARFQIDVSRWSTERASASSSSAFGCVL